PPNESKVNHTRPNIAGRDQFDLSIADPIAIAPPFVLNLLHLHVGLCARRKEKAQDRQQNQFPHPNSPKTICATPLYHSQTSAPRAGLPSTSRVKRARKSRGRASVLSPTAISRGSLLVRRHDSNRVSFLSVSRVS